MRRGLPSGATNGLQTVDLSVRFGGHLAVSSVSCAFEPGTLTAIVGPNGAGKTTYFNLISGQLRQSSGRVLLCGEDISTYSASRRTKSGVGRAFQLTNLFPKLTVYENVRIAIQSRSGASFNFWSMSRSHEDLKNLTERVLHEASLWESRHFNADELSHGDQRKLDVAVLMALEPRVYMFDEPTAGMGVADVPMILDMIQRLKRAGDKIIVLVEHKMDVIRTLADRVVVLNAGQLVADGVPDEVMRSSIVREAYLGKKRKFSGEAKQ